MIINTNAIVSTTEANQNFHAWHGSLTHTVKPLYSGTTGPVSLSM